MSNCINCINNGLKCPYTQIATPNRTAPDPCPYYVVNNYACITTTSNTSILYYRNNCRRCGKIFKTILPFNVICEKCMKKKNKIERKISKLHNKLKSYEDYSNFSIYENKDFTI